MGDKSPKDKQKGKDQKAHEAQKIAQKQQAERDAKTAKATKK